MTDAALGPGTVLDGRFRLEDLLEESADARFWRATDLVLARNVSVHVLPDTDPRAPALLDAARSSALVSDIRLLRVLDAATGGGQVYVVHEWGSGVSLDRMIAENALSPRRAAWVVKEVAEAITTAHRNGVAHGRLIPENVMISESGSVKLIGFVVDAALRSPGGAHRGLDGAPVSAAESDVLNLAALLYAALVGRWPGTEGSTIPVAPAEHGRPLRPRRVRAGVPRPLDAICEQVLNADAHPGATPIETAQEIAAALGDFIGDPAGSTAVTRGFGTPGAAVPHEDPDPADAGPAARQETSGDETGEDEPVRTDVDTADLAATGLMSAADLPGEASADPEATQLSAPLLPGDTGDSGAPPPGPSPDPSPGRSPHPSSAPSPAEQRFPPVPERPLFADGPPRQPLLSRGRATEHSRSELSGSFLGALNESTSTQGGPATGQRSTGAGNGPLPTAWGPDADEPPVRPLLDEPDRDDPVPGRRWLRLAIVLGVVVALVVTGIVAYSLSRGTGDDATSAPASPSASSTAAASRTWPITAVRDFDPEADPPEENSELAKLAVDGDPATAWRTVTYTRPNLGGLKSGVGLAVDLGRTRSVSEVRLRLVGKPTAVRVLVGGADTPTTTEGLKTLDSDDDAGASVDLRTATAVHTRWLVVWLTSLPPVSDGYQGQVAEVSVRS